MAECKWPRESDKDLQHVVVAGPCALCQVEVEKVGVQGFLSQHEPIELDKEPPDDHIDGY